MGNMNMTYDELASFLYEMAHAVELAASLSEKNTCRKCAKQETCEHYREYIERVNCPLWEKKERLIKMNRGSRTDKLATDYISRQAAIDIVEFECGEWRGLAGTIVKAIEQLPFVQPERQTDCEYCHEDSDGYVRSIEKNSHAWLIRRGKTMKLRIGFKGEYRECDVLFCPMCGRRLTDG